MFTRQLKDVLTSKIIRLHKLSYSPKHLNSDKFDTQMVLSKGNSPTG